jgi:zinc/manganese transport system permease protein
MEQIFYIPSTMLWPLMACFVLTGILCYLGVHVIARQVIFVDLALAQIAALGTVTGVLLGYEVGKDANILYLYSLAFTFLGAFIFSMTKMRGEKVPHEAIIGIVYAVAFAATMLVLARSPLGPQELDRIIKGELLWVQAPLVIKTTIIYLVIGIFHFIFRKKFIPISFDSAKAEASGINVRLWDFLFYMSFGFVITSSVAIAGVFLVFSYLVIPAVAAILHFEHLGKRLAMGWIGGSIISFIGVKMSWHTGLPTSPLIVVLLALALVVGAILRYIRIAENKGRAVFNIAASTVIFALFIGGIFFFRKTEEDPLEHTLHLLESKLSTDRQSAIRTLELYTAEKSRWLPLLIERLKDDDAVVRKEAVELLTKMKEQSALSPILELLHDNSDEVKNAVITAAEELGTRETGQRLVEFARHQDDPEIQLRLLHNALKLGEPTALPFLTEIMSQEGIFAEDAYTILREHLQYTFTINDANKLQQWLRQNFNKLEWDYNTKKFFVE